MQIVARRAWSRRKSLSRPDLSIGPPPQFGVDGEVEPGVRFPEGNRNRLPSGFGGSVARRASFPIGRSHTSARESAGKPDGPGFTGSI